MVDQEHVARRAAPARARRPQGGDAPGCGHTGRLLTPRGRGPGAVRELPRSQVSARAPGDERSPSAGTEQVRPRGHRCWAGAGRLLEHRWSAFRRPLPDMRRGSRGSGATRPACTETVPTFTDRTRGGVLSGWDSPRNGDRMVKGRNWTGPTGPAGGALDPDTPNAGEFIAHARTNLPTSVAEVERLREALERFRQAWDAG